MDREIHEMLCIFEQNAEMLRLRRSKDDLDDALAELAEWLARNAHALDEDDLVVLSRIGGIVYRAAATGPTRPGPSANEA